MVDQLNKIGAQLVQGLPVAYFVLTIVYNHKQREPCFIMIALHRQPGGSHRKPAEKNLLRYIIPLRTDMHMLDFPNVCTANDSTYTLCRGGATSVMLREPADMYMPVCMVD